MSRTAARFTQADVARAVKGMLAAGLTVTGARVDRDGNIEVLCAGERAQAPAQVPRTLSEWRSRPRDAR